MKQWVFVLLLLMVSCASDPLLEVDVQIAANQSSNPLLDISAGFSSGQSRGVYFILDPLSPNPSGINDTTGSTIETPSLTGLGQDPLQDTFTIDPELLESGTLYRLRMIAIDSNGTQTHEGTSDCPIFLDLQSQDVKLCFGNAASVPLCGGTTEFACCEGINQPGCSQ